MLRTDPYAVIIDGELWMVTAEIGPSGSRWLPWPGRMSRWWYELEATEDDEITLTWAYRPGGSGGGFTLRRCLKRVFRAIERIEQNGFEGDGK